MVTTAFSSSGSSVHLDDRGDHDDPELSDYSLISSLGALSISFSDLGHGSRYPLGTGRLGSRGISSTGSTSSSDDSRAGASAAGGGTSVRAGPSKSARRRARARWLREREAAAVDDILGVNDETPRKAKPATRRETASSPAPSPRLSQARKTESSAPSSDDGALVRKGHKTRRGGKKVHERAERGQLRDALAVEDEIIPNTPRRRLVASPPTSASVSQLSRSPVSGDCDDDEYSEDGASRLLDEEFNDDDDEEEVDALSALGTGSAEAGTSHSGHVSGPPSSIMSSEDAKYHIDAFTKDLELFARDKANKLRLWQALCVELGLVELEDNSSSSLEDNSPSSLEDNSPSSLEDNHPDSPSARPSRALQRSDSPRSESRSPTPTPSRTPTPRPRLPPLPQTLNQARRLLKSEAHVNILDYFEDRKQGLDSYAHLNHHSKAAMMRATRKEGKLANLDNVKHEWLEPLLKDFGFRRRRTSH